MRVVAFLIFLLFTCTARADAFYKLVGYECDAKKNRLVLTYDAAANGEGEALLRGKRSNQWNPWDLITMKDDDNIGSLETIERACRLSDGVYSVSFGPAPGNWNLQRKCGAWMSAWAEVRRGARVVYPRSDFERGGGCFFADGEIVTRVEVNPGQNAPKIWKRPAEKLLSGT